MESLRGHLKVDRPRCPYCHEALEPEDAKTGCETCLAWHHKDCWAEHGRCSACGVSSAPGLAASVDELDDLPRLPELMRQLDDPTPGAAWEALTRIGALGERASGVLSELIERAAHADPAVASKFQETIAKVKGRFQRRARAAEDESEGASGCFENGIVLGLVMFILLPFLGSLVFVLLFYLLRVLI